MNSATKLVLLLDDSDLATHLLHMCPQKWQRQNALNNHSTPLSARALLLVLKNIETNVKVDHKPPSNNKAKGADSKQKMESIVSWIPKKAHKGLGHWTKKHCSLCKKHGDVHIMHNTCDCNWYSPDPRCQGAQQSLTRKIATQVVQTSCRLFMQSARKLSALSSKRLQKVRSAMIIATKVTVTLTLISEVLGSIAQGNCMFVRN